MNPDDHNHLTFALTSDGSKTLYNAKVGEHYHSRHGALQESRHVFLETGLKHYLTIQNTSKARVLEVGFGTGLNFLVSAEYAASNMIDLDYTGIEAYPLPAGTIALTGYDQYIPAGVWNAFLQQYPAALLGRVALDTRTSFEVRHTSLLSFSTDDEFDVIYFDAFAAIHQPEMWSMESLAHVTRFLRTSGVFVTYAITGDLKRNMKALGFVIEKVPGAAGKREMLRAVKH